MGDNDMRKAFEAWCKKAWGVCAWRHMSNACGEWEAWQAATLAERERIAKDWDGCSTKAGLDIGFLIRAGKLWDKA